MKRYTVWKVDADGEGFQVNSAGETIVKENALEKARKYNDALLKSDPESSERYVVRDDAGKEIK